MYTSDSSDNALIWVSQSSFLFYSCEMVEELVSALLE